MACTTILVGKNASNDGSTMIARTDDGHFDVKKIIVVEPKDTKRVYKSVISHAEVELPENPMRFTACPNVEPGEGVWAATGINSANVGMTATETITSNPRVLAADPFVNAIPPKTKRDKWTPGGIGEEDFVMLVLPFVKTAREGVLRLGELLEKYGTYEANGIAFNDENEVWWMETIGGHHWIAKRLPDNMCVIAPNRQGLDIFDLKDAFGPQKEHLCSKDLRKFISENNLDLNRDGNFNPRKIFGSDTDSDRIYNNPRAWFMGRYLCPDSMKWEGEGADYGPESGDIPWAVVPDRLVTVEDVKYLLSSHFQGTPFDPYSNRDTGVRGKYRSIGINRTGVMTVCQIRPDVRDEIKGLEWVCFGSTTFDAIVPVYTNVPKLPAYLSNVEATVSTENFYWSSRLIGALADENFPSCIQHIERYQAKTMIEGRRIIAEYDRKIGKIADKEQIEALAAKANAEVAEMAKKETDRVLGNVLREASVNMKNGYRRSDN